MNGEEEGGERGERKIGERDRLRDRDITFGVEDLVLIIGRRRRESG